MGESCVPAEVERVVAREWTYAEDLLALGVQPVGVADIAGYESTKAGSIFRSRWTRA